MLLWLAALAAYAANPAWHVASEEELKALIPARAPVISERIETEFYAKLLGILIQHWLILTVGWHWVERSLVKIGQAIRETIRAFCLVWQEPEHLASFCTRLTHIIEKTARISSHCHQESTARRVMRA